MAGHLWPVGIEIRDPLCQGLPSYHWKQQLPSGRFAQLDTTIILHPYLKLWGDAQARDYLNIDIYKMFFINVLNKYTWVGTQKAEGRGIATNLSPAWVTE